jgi:8-oxo-dGTP pyrophosphatase MutT (NUDIX family)
MSFKTYFSHQHIGAGIVFVTSKKNILLLQKHNKKWTFPGGHTEIGETPIQTATRECEEELGVLPFNIEIKEPPLIIVKNNNLLYSFFQYIDTPFKPSLSKEHISYRWFNINDINEDILTNVFSPHWLKYRNRIS